MTASTWLQTAHDVQASVSTLTAPGAAGGTSGAAGVVLDSAAPDCVALVSPLLSTVPCDAVTGHLVLPGRDPDLDSPVRPP